MTSCCENNLLLNQKDALERLANTIENMPENDSILEFPITKIDDVKKVRVILRKSKDDYNFVITQERCNKELYRRIWNSDVSSKEIATSVTVDLKKMRFNKMENEFRTCASSNTLMEGSDWISLFEHNSEHIKLNYEECCICGDNTRLQMSKCTHFVCLPCGNNIKEEYECESDEDDEEGLWEGYLRCPICRGKNKTNYAFSRVVL